MRNLGKSLVLVFGLVLGMGACGDFGGLDGIVAVEQDAGASVAVDARVVSDMTAATSACVRYECQFRCDDGGTTNGNPTGPWNGCYCIGYRCLARGPVACSPHVAGCVVISPGVLDAGLP